MRIRDDHGSLSVCTPNYDVSGLDENPRQVSWVHRTSAFSILLQLSMPS